MMSRISLEKIIVYFLMIGAGVYVFLMLIEGFTYQGVSDFGTYYHTTSFALQERGKNPYSNHAPYPPYYYPPPSVVMFSPLLLMDQMVAKTLFSWLSIIVVIASVFLIIRLLGEGLSDLQKVLLYCSAIFFYPLYFTISDGQINAYLLILLTLIYYLFSRGKEATSGVLLGIAILFKITPALLAAYFLWKKKYRLVLYTILTFAVLTIISELILDPGINWMYWRYIVNDVASQGGAGYRDQSLNAFIIVTGMIGFLWNNYLDNLSLPSKFSEGVLASLVSYSIVGITSLVVFYRSFKDKVSSSTSTILEYSLLVVIAVTGSGLTWFHQYTMLLFPFIVALIMVMKLPSSNTRNLLSSLMGISYIVMAVSLENQFTIAGDLESLDRSVMFYGAVILFAVLAYFRYFLPKSEKL